MSTRDGDVLFVEGVPYLRYVVSYVLASGPRRRMVRWSPGYPWVRSEIARELVDRFGDDGIRPHSVTIRQRSLAPRPPRSRKVVS